MLAPSNSSTPFVLSPPHPHPLSSTLLSSYHRTVRGLRVRGDNLNSAPPPPLRLRGRAGRGRLPPGQTPLPRPDGRRNHLVPGTQQGAYAPPPPSNWPRRTTATTVIPQCPVPAAFWPLLEASVLLSLHRLGRWPHLSWLPLHRPYGGPPLQLSHSSHGSGLGRYVDGTPPGPPIPGRASTVQWPAPIADRFRLLSFITFIPAVGSLLPGHQRDHIILISPFTPLHLTCGLGVISPLRN